MSDLISMDKQYKTCDGRAVRILSIDLKNSSLPVIGAVFKRHREELVQFTPYGVSSAGSHFDLIEVKPRIKRDVWMNIYSGKHFACYLTKEEADKYSGNMRLACIKVEIDCEHGEGL